jgi:predicted transcriptional regulator
MLCILGKEPDVQKAVLNTHDQNTKNLNSAKTGILRKKLENLINFCKKKSISIISNPFNTHTSTTIINNYILEAQLIYENMISLDDIT